MEGFKWAPLLSFTVCFLAQAHVSFWLPCAFLVVASLALASVGPRRADRRWLALSGAIALVLWLPPLIEWHNLVLIFRHFTRTAGAEHSAVEALTGLTVLIGQSVTGGPVVFPRDAVSYSRPFWAGIALIVTAIVAMHSARHNRFIIVFGGLVFGSLLTFAFALTRFTGPIGEQSIIYMTLLGPLLLLLVAQALLQHSPAATVVSTACMLVLVTYLWEPFKLSLVLETTPMAGVRAFSETLSRKLASQNDPVVYIDQAIWPIAFGGLAQAYRDGVPFRIDSRWSIVFAHQVGTATTGAGVMITGTNEEPKLVAVP